MECSRIWCCIIAALVSSTALIACQTDVGSNFGRIALALNGQFFEGELQSLDLYVYAASTVECDEDTGTISLIPTTYIESETNISLEETSEITFEIPQSDYVVYAEAGQRADGEFNVIAQGCSTITLGSQLLLELYLHRSSTCGDNTLDIHEMCDDGNTDSGDGCDSHCATEQQWANDDADFRNGNQSAPIAAGYGNLLALCWRSDNVTSQMAPSAWFDALGAVTFRDLINDNYVPRRCDSLDVRGNTVIMIFYGAHESRDPEHFIIGWSSTNRLDAELLAESHIPRAAVALISESEAVTVVENLSGLELRTVEIISSGITLNTETAMVDTELPNPESPAIAGGDSEFVVAFESANGVFARHFVGVSEPSAETQSLCPEGSECNSPAVAGLGGRYGTLYLVVFLGEGDQIFGAFIETNGIATEAFAISEGTLCGEPVVAVLDHEDTFVVAWSEQVGSDDSESSRIYARAVTGVNEFTQISTGTALVSEPFQVTPDSGSSFDQPAIATTVGTSDPTTALVFFRDSAGIDGDILTDTDIGFRRIRVPSSPSGF